MVRYFGLQITGLLIVVIGAVTVLFAVHEMIPGDPIRAFAGERLRAEQVEVLRREFGLDDPFLVRYVNYLKNLARGDLGISLTTYRTVREDLRIYFPATLELTIVTMFVITVLGVPLGVLAALGKGRGIDQASRILAFVGAGLPVFWLGLMLQVLFYGRLGWLPGGGRITFGVQRPNGPTGLYVVDSILAGDLTALGSVLVHLILPVATLALGRFTVVTRLIRSTMIEVLQEDYIRTARAKGAREARVAFRHALRNAVIPALTILGLQFGWVLQGTLLVEVVFSYPGMGYYAVNGIFNHDLPVILGVTLVMAITFVVMNFLVDTLYVAIDPRIRMW